MSGEVARAASRLRSKRTEGGETGEVRFAGYAAIFDRVDRGGDVVRAGAFGPDADGKLAAAGVPLLWQHGPGSVIGRIEKAQEDGRGLRVIGRVSRATAAGREAAAALASGALDGLSFGYRVKAARGAGPRELLALELVEVSLVTHPMQPLARVLKVEG
ncbi:HK97 family phage prohead protease [Sphingobium lactosutens]|uniref:HK97 family phage prohead protease n=1 Tax=Sphingobium lactosutens TaxID=522773 RepID=UPI0015BB0968|nr:HK97 family phage prohead protease [Sphingobium lactosutens]NWK98057.1 HK97 family phage prohead protease [Sphingobium lactosutens]